MHPLCWGIHLAPSSSEYLEILVECNNADSNEQITIEVYSLTEEFVLSVLYRK